MKIVLTLILSALLCSCATNKVQSTKELIWEVSDTLVSCEGVSTQNCIQVREPGGEWSPLYNSIENFNYKEGYAYTIKVTETTLQNPPADGSSKKYELITITSQKNTSGIINGVPRLSGSFIITKINGRAAPDKELTMIVNEKTRTISGFSGCNTYNLTYKQKGFQLRFSQVSSTRRYCEKEAQLEKEFLITYTLGDRFELYGDILKIYDIDNEILEAKRFVF